MRTLILLVILFYALPCMAQSSGGIGPGKDSRDGHTLKDPVIQSKPEPNWPKIKGTGKFTVVLKAAFRSNAKVTDVSVVEIKPEKPESISEDDVKALSKRAIDAAYLIKFIPATKDGKAVSMWMRLEYLFEFIDDPSNQPAKKK